VIDLESVCSWGDVVEVQETTRIHESNLTKTGGTVEGSVHDARRSGSRHTKNVKRLNSKKDEDEVLCGMGGLAIWRQVTDNSTNPSD